MTHERCIFGIHPVTEWLRAQPAHLRALQYDTRLAERFAGIVDLAAHAGVRHAACSADVLDRLAGTPRHQGVVATAAPFPYVEFERVLATPARLLVIADRLQDPHNLGAVLRTAEATGAGAVLIPKDGAVGVTATVEVAAAGAAALLPVCRITNTVRALQQLKAAGYWTVGLIPRQGTDLYRFDPPERIVMVVGGETGMRPLVARHCDFAVSIPMHGRVESLNASVAAAVVMYEVLRRRRAPSAPIVTGAAAV